MHQCVNHVSGIICKLCVDKLNMPAVRGHFCILRNGRVESPCEPKVRRVRQIRRERIWSHEVRPQGRNQGWFRTIPPSPPVNKKPRFSRGFLLAVGTVGIRALGSGAARVRQIGRIADLDVRSEAKYARSASAKDGASQSLPL